MIGVSIIIIVQGVIDVGGIGTVYNITSQRGRLDFFKYVQRMANENFPVVVQMIGFIICLRILSIFHYPIASSVSINVQRFYPTTYTFPLSLCQL